MLDTQQDTAQFEPLWFLKSTPDYHRTRWWKHRRIEFLETHGTFCDACNDLPWMMGKDELLEFDVHHVTYERLGQERDEDLRCLCICCHNALHWLLKRFGGVSGLAAQNWLTFYPELEYVLSGMFPSW